MSLINCKYCGTPLDPTTDCGCGCDGANIAGLKAENIELRRRLKIATKSSWQGETDTASGAFTQWEKDNANKW